MIGCTREVYVIAGADFFAFFEAEQYWNKTPVKTMAINNNFFICISLNIAMRKIGKFPIQSVSLTSTK